MYGFSAYSQTAYSALPDTSGGATTYYVDNNEAITASDSSAAIQLLNAALTAASNTSAQFVARVDYACALNAALNGTDTQVGVTVYSPSVNEALSSFDSQSAIYIYVTQVNEAADAAASTDEITAYNVVNSEAISADGTSTAITVYGVNVAELFDGAETVAAFTSYGLALSESMEVINYVAPGGIIFASVIEAIYAQDAPDALTQYNLIITAAADGQAPVSATTVYNFAQPSAITASASQTGLRVVLFSLNEYADFQGQPDRDQGLFCFVEEALQAAGASDALTNYYVNSVAAVDAVELYAIGANIVANIVEGVNCSAAMAEFGLWAPVSNTASGSWQPPDGGGSTPSGGWNNSASGNITAGGWQNIETVPN